MSRPATGDASSSRRKAPVGWSKAVLPQHVRENRAAYDIRLTDRDLSELDTAFPPPDHKIPLEMV